MTSSKESFTRHGKRQWDYEYLRAWGRLWQTPQETIEAWADLAHASHASPCVIEPRYLRGKHVGWYTIDDITPGEYRRKMGLERLPTYGEFRERFPFASGTRKRPAPDSD